MTYWVYTYMLHMFYPPPCQRHHIEGGPLTDFRLTTLSGCTCTSYVFNNIGLFLKKLLIQNIIINHSIQLSIVLLLLGLCIM
jgi:hypothetical protein